MWRANSGHLLPAQDLKGKEVMNRRTRRVAGPMVEGGALFVGIAYKAPPREWVRGGGAGLEPDWEVR